MLLDIAFIFHLTEWPVINESHKAFWNLENKKEKEKEKKKSLQK
jgi:hypothetical protein